MIVSRKERRNETDNNLSSLHWFHRRHLEVMVRSLQMIVHVGSLIVSHVLEESTNEKWWSFIEKPQFSLNMVTLTVFSVIISSTITCNFAEWVCIFSAFFSEKLLNRVIETNLEWKRRAFLLDNETNGVLLRMFPEKIEAKDVAKIVAWTLQFSAKPERKHPGQSKRCPFLYHAR